MATPADQSAGRGAEQQSGLLADLAGAVTTGEVQTGGTTTAQTGRSHSAVSRAERIQSEHAQAQADEPHPSFHGRPVSWVAVSIVMVAFVIGGLALVFGPVWWLFWVAVGLTVVGGLLGAATNIFEDWY